jgi:hypothetical protein
VKLAQTLLDRNVRVCGTVRANRGILRDLEGEGKCLNKGQSAFQRKGDVMVQMRKDKRLVRMISMIRNATIMNTGRRDMKTNMEIKKPDAVVQYHKFMKAVDKADHYGPSYTRDWLPAYSFVSSTGKARHHKARLFCRDTRTHWSHDSLPLSSGTIVQLSNVSSMTQYHESKRV